MAPTILNYFQHFSIDEERSTSNTRVFVVTLSNGRTLDPVTLRVPAYATVMDVDAFMEEVRRGTAPDPLTRAATLVQDLLALTSTVLSWAPTDAHASRIINANQGLETADNLIEVAIMTTNEHHMHIVIRNEVFSAAATVVTMSANIMINVLRELRHADEICEEEFDYVFTISLNAFKVNVLRLGFRSNWFV